MYYFDNINNFVIAEYMFISDMRLLWDLVTGAQFTQMIDRLTESIGSMFSSTTVINPIDNPTVNPIADFMGPLLEVLENNELNGLLDINTLRQYISGETEENNSLVQLVQSEY